MLLDGSNNQFGGDGSVPGGPEDGGPGNSNPPRDSWARGGLRDIFNKHKDKFKAYDESKKSNGLKDIFRKGPKQAARDYAYNKGKDYLKNTDTGKKITKGAKDLLKPLDKMTGGMAGKLNRAGFVPGADKEEMKKKAQDYMKKEGKQKLKDAIEGRFKGGIKKGVKEGGEKLVKKGTKDLAEVGTKATVKASANLLTTGAVDATVETLGAVGNFALPIISEVLAQLIVIAISLGISDAIDGAAALAGGHVKEAMHLFIRAATKIVVFASFVVSAIICAAILPVVGFVIPLVLIHIYWGLSIVPFVNEMAIFQGLVWWEKLAIVIMDLVILFYLGMGVLVGLYIYCNIGSLAGSESGGSIGSTIGGAVDSVSQGSYCSAFQGADTSSPGAGDSGSAGSGSSVPAEGSVPAGMVDAKTIIPDLVVEMRYATTNNFMAKVLYAADKQPGNKCLLKVGVANNLKKAQDALSAKSPAGQKLKVLDCYRPVPVQQEMYDWGKPKGYVPTYIAEPGSGQHPKGEAIDLTIVSSNGSELGMPSKFDEFSANAGKSNANSQLLEEVMRAGNLTRIPSEWWHFH